MIIQTLDADFGERSYKLYYGANLLDSFTQYIPNLLKDSVFFVIATQKTKELFAEKIETALKGYRFHWEIINDGEEFKNLETVNNLYESLSKQKINKGSFVIALGGGVLQDISSYTCATYRRGLQFIQIPTTVLSQADIGVGGCAVNHKYGKSLIGTFYQPVVVINDIHTIKTLPDEEKINGLAEIICKIVCIGGDKLDTIETTIPKLLTDDTLLAEYISLSAKYKKQTAESDETGKKGLRIVIDYGHTVTYALEALMKYKIKHGFALGVGMVIDTALSFQKGFISKEKFLFLKHLIKSAGLPTQLPKGIDIDSLIKQMTYDQKSINGEIRFILLKDFGKPFLSDPVSVEEIKSAILLSEEET